MREKKKKFFKKFLTYLNGKPLSKILGLREFYSYNFFIDGKTLDPRPESELLIDEAIKIVRKRKKKQTNILELGVGSGCLSITLFMELKKLKLKINLIGTDIKNNALKVANANKKKFNISHENFKFIKSNWFLNVRGKFDIIISNPPYIATKDINLLEKTVTEYDPIIAIDGGKDGLECYRKISRNVCKFLNNNGFLILEIGCNQKDFVKEIFEKEKLIFVKCLKDLAFKNRCMIFKKKIC